jgi:hypothetical protein
MDSLKEIEMDPHVMGQHQSDDVAVTDDADMILWVAGP